MGLDSFTALIPYGKREIEREGEREREKEREKECFYDNVCLSLSLQPTNRPQRENVVVIGAPYFWGAPFHIIRLRFVFTFLFTYLH